MNNKNNLIIKKKTVKSTILENSYFFTGYTLLLISGFIILLVINKGDCVIFFNDWRGGFSDEIFKFFSSLGEGEYFGILLLILGIYNAKYLILGLSVYFGSGLVSQILKNMFKIPRPKVFFENSDLVVYVKNFELFSWNSFPSGHSTSGFAIFLFLAIITKNKKIGAFYLICAFMVGMSRVYLVQHFLIDVYFGSMVGVLFTIFIYNAFENSIKITNSNWYNFSLMKKIKK